jgi:hypothetical protein
LAFFAFVANLFVTAFFIWTRSMLNILKLGLPLLVGAAAVGGCSAISSPTRSTGSDGAGGYGSPSTGSGASGGTSAEGNTRVGEACILGDDCGTHPDSFCVASGDSQPIFTTFWGGDEIGGGVAGGYCTRTCSTEAPCPEGSRCGGGICLALCDFGSPSFASIDAALSPEKCHGRDDLMCVPSSAGESVCMPNCGAGSDCEGRACDARYGICTDPDRSGSLNGAQCTLDNATTEEDEDLCAGLCLEITDADDAVMATVCSSRCSLGGVGQDCGGPEVGACAIQRVDADGIVPQLGDEGFCAGACGAHDGCEFASGLFCFDLGNYDAFATGYCLRADSCEGVPCDDGRLCTDTANGKVCLDDAGSGTPLFPLGLATP